MPDRPDDDLRAELAALIDALARGARLALLLDERQPDAVRVAALAMPPECLFWTLTQLDGGLPLDICQAPVPAARRGRGRPIAPDLGEAERWSAATAGVAASAGWRGAWPPYPRRRTSRTGSAWPATSRRRHRRRRERPGRRRRAPAGWTCRP
jgi:hypothetical protein